MDKRILSAEDDVFKALELIQQRELDYNTLLMRMQGSTKGESDNIDKLTKINEHLK